MSIIHEALKRAQSAGGAGAGEPGAGAPSASSSHPVSPPPATPFTRALVWIALAVGVVALFRMGCLFLDGWEGRARMPEPARLSPAAPVSPSPPAPAAPAGVPVATVSNPTAGEATAEELFTLGDLEGAERLLRRELARPGAPDPVAANNLGLVLKRKGAAREALEWFDLALRGRPAFPEALNNRAVTLRALGRDAEAETDLKTALALDPAFAEAQLDYGVLLDSRGRGGEALRLYRAYLANPARTPGVEEALVRQRAVALESELAVSQWSGTGGTTGGKGR